MLQGRVGERAELRGGGGAAERRREVDSRRPARALGGELDPRQTGERGEDVDGAGDGLEAVGQVQGFTLSTIAVS